MKKALATIDKGVEYVESGICLVTMITIAVIATIQIVLRYILLTSIPWGEEIIQALMVVMVMFGAARATRMGSHTEMDGVALILPKYLRLLLLTFTTFITLGYLVVILISSTQFMLSAGTQKSIMLRIPMPYMYMSMPIGSLFMIYEFVKTIKSRLTKRRS